MTQPANRKPQAYRIRESLDVFAARRAGRALAMSLGFGRREAEEMVIVISELATNIVKYGIQGDITIETVQDETLGLGIQVTARDVGPPFADLALALKDGWSDRGPIDPLQITRRGGIGAGLGAVVRFSDAFEYLPGEGEKRIRVTRYRLRPRIKR
jgi:anti-sigma regulatory factor (Ser/Thr protein kinase)